MKKPLCLCVSVVRLLPRGGMNMRGVQHTLTIIQLE